MFDIYIKDFNQNGQIITTETLVQTVPSLTEGDLKLIGPIVRNEMGNAESFNFSIQSGTKFYDSFNQMKTFIRVLYDDETIFYGRVLTIDNGFYGDRKIRCEGPLAFLNDTSIEGTREETRQNYTVNEYLSVLINNHNSMVNDSKRFFTLGEVPGNYTEAVTEAQRIKNNSRKYGSDSWQDTKSAVEDLRSHYGGYLKVRCLGHKSGNTYVDDGHYLDWMDHYFNKDENTQTFEVGKNIIDISSTTEIDNIFTVVIPIGNTKVTHSDSVDGESRSSGPKHFYVPGKEVTVPSICEKYGSALNFGYHTYDDYAYALEKYGRIIKTVVFDDANNADELLEKCQEWIKNNYQGEVTKFTVKAVDMHQIGDSNINKIMVGDRVHLIYPVFKEDGTVETRNIVRTCLSISYDLYNPENNSYTFGIPANSLTKSYGVLKQGKSSTDPQSKPPHGGSGGSSGSASWLSKVIDWLTNHKIFYKHLANGQVQDNVIYPGDIDSRAYPAHFPYTEENKAYMKGPGVPANRQYFYTSEYGGGIGSFLTWQFTSLGQSSEFDKDTLDKILKQVEDAFYGTKNIDKRELLTPEQEVELNKLRLKAEKNYLNSCTYNEFSAKMVALQGPITQEDIIRCKIIEYVKSEFGIDLTNFSNVKMPSITIKNEDGSTDVYEAAEGKVITKEMFTPGYQAEDIPGFHFIMSQDGRNILSCQDTNGHWQYYMIDPKTGQVVETSVRDLTMDTVETDNQRAFITSTYFKKPVIIGYDEDGKPIYQRDEHGNIVYEKDPETGEDIIEAYDYIFGQTIEKYADGELVVTRVDGDKVILGGKHTDQITNAALRNISSVCGDFEVTTDEYGHDHIIVKDGSGIFQKRDGVELGYYHDGNLTAGVVVNKINEAGETEAKISADQVRIQGRTFVQAGLVDGNHYRKVDLSRYPDDVNPRAQGWYNINDKGEYFLTGDDHIVPTHKYFEINPREGMVTGELLIQHINDNETEAKLTADQVRINGRTFFQAGLVEDDYLEVTLYGGEDPAAEGLYEYDKVNKKYVLTGDHSVYPGKHYYRKNPNGGMLTAGILVDKINDQNVTFIRGDRVVVGDTASEESVMSALMTSGVVTSSKVNLNEWPSNVNPQKQGWYNINNAGEYFLTGDTEVIAGHEYFYAPHNGKASRALVANSIYTKEINAINGHFRTIEADYVKTEFLQSKISALNLVNVQAIAAAKADAYCSLNSYYGNHYYFNVSGGGGEVTHKDMRYMLDYVTVTDNGNGTNTIKLHSIMNGELSKSNKPSYMSDDVFDSLTFTSAVTLNKRAWSNGIYTPSAAKGKILNPTDGMTKIGSILAPTMIDDPDNPGQKKYNDPWVTGTYTVHRYFDVYHTWLNDKDEWESANTGFRTEVSINASAVYTSGQNDVGIGSAVWYETGRPKDSTDKDTNRLNDYVQVSTTGRPTNLTTTEYIAMTADDWNTSDNSRKVYVRHGDTLANASKVDIDTNIVCLYKIGAGTIRTAGQNDVTVGSVVWNETGRPASDTNRLNDYVTMYTSGRSSNVGKSEYIAMTADDWNTSDNSRKVYVRHGDTLANASKVDIDTNIVCLYKIGAGTIRTAGKNDVGIGSASWNETGRPASDANRQSNYVQVSTTGRPTNLTTTEYVAITTDDWNTSDNTRKVYIRQGATAASAMDVSKDTNIVCLYKIGGGTIYENGRTQGKNDVGIGSASWHELGRPSGDSNRQSDYVQVSTTGRPTNLTTTEYVAITTDDWKTSDNTRKVYVRRGTDTTSAMDTSQDSNIVCMYKIGAGTIRTAGQNDVSVAISGWGDGLGRPSGEANRDTNYVIASTSGRKTNVTASEYVAITTDDWDNDNYRKIYIRRGTSAAGARTVSSDSNIVCVYKIGAATVYNRGSVVGWNNACGNVKFDYMHMNDDYFPVSYPNTITGGGTATTSTNYLKLFRGYTDDGKDDNKGYIVMYVCNDDGTVKYTQACRFQTPAPGGSSCGSEYQMDRFTISSNNRSTTFYIVKTTYPLSTGPINVFEIRQGNSSTSATKVARFKY